MKPRRAMPAPRVMRPTMMARAPASAMAVSGSPAARGRMVAAIMGPRAESGPRTRIGEGPMSAYATRQTTVV